MHDRSPSYFFSQFMPFCNNWFRNAFAKLDGRLQSKLGFAEFTKQVIMKTDWRLVWASGEISEDLNAIVALFNTALVAQWVIEEIIDADDDPAPRIDVWRWKEI